jgi:hypothetical protein
MIDNLKDYVNKTYNPIEIGIAKALIIDEIQRQPHTDFNKLFKNADDEVKYLASIFDMPQQLIRTAILELHTNITILQFAQDFDKAMKEIGLY